MVRASEISANYVLNLRGRGYSWSAVARMTGATEIDLRRLYDGLDLDPASRVPSVREKAAPARVAATQPKPRQSAEVIKVAPRRKPRVRYGDDGRLRTVLVAAGLSLDHATIIVRMLDVAPRCPGVRLLTRGMNLAPDEACAMVEAAQAAGRRLGISFRDGPSLGLDSEGAHFLRRLAEISAGRAA